MELILNSNSVQLVYVRNLSNSLELSEKGSTRSISRITGTQRDPMLNQSPVIKNVHETKQGPKLLKALIKKKKSNTHYNVNFPSQKHHNLPQAFGKL